MKAFVTALTIALAACVISGCTTEYHVSATKDIRPVSLRCEYLVNPLGIDVVKPRLSWKLESNQRGQKQTAYRVLVASSRDKLNKGVGDLWDTGKVKSDRSIHVAYAGKPLKSQMRCCWKVMVWNKDGVASAWSKPTKWSMGLLNPEDWQAKWISTDVPTTTTNDTIYIRRQFTLNAPVRSALAYVNVRGSYELYINGQKVSDDVLSPAVTGLEKYLLYRTYDITSYLKPGQNCVGIWLAQGWCQSASWEHVKPLARVQLEINTSGQSYLIGTDNTWLCTPSSHSRLGQWKWNDMGGERIDARRAIDGWSKAGINKDSWQPVKEVTPPPGKVASQSCAPNRIGKTIPLKAIRKLAPDTWELDFGTNLTGWMRLRLAKLNPGDKITMRYADKHFDNPAGERTPAGSIKPNSQWVVDTPQGQVCYQTYSQIDEFISAGNPNEEFCSKFNYHGFRYVIIQGLSKAPAINDAEALLVETDMGSAGSFQCSKDLFNRIHDVNIWTIRCLNLGGQMVDCPHRERMGYGDAQTSIETQIMARNSAAFYSKWAHDWMADQDPTTGQFPHTSPRFVNSWGGPGWGGLACVLPWKMYLYYEDTRLLERAYQPMRRYVEFLESKCTNDILRQNSLGKNQFLGDWVPPRRGMDTGNWPQTPACELFNNGYRVYLMEILQRSAKALGKTEDTQKYAAKIEKIKPIIHSAFYDDKKQQYVIDEQAYQVMPLMTGIVPESLRQTVRQRLENIIMVKNKGHLDTGMLGTSFLIQYLQQAGRNDLLYTIYNQQTYPGWGYMLSQGATTFWEQWNGYWSQIHSCFAGPSSWFYQGLAGISPDPASPAFKKIIIKPAIVGDLTWVNCHHDSPYGRIVSNWKLKENKLTMNVTVPPNTTATVYVPASQLEDVTESEKKIDKATGVSFIKMEKNTAVFKVESGTYKFASKNYPEE